MQNAIPTRYGGIQFRSRLEARWAAFFDRLNWRWDYEPLDLAGWIPDFVIHGERPVLVEVKPIWSFDETVGQKITKAAGGGYEILLLGHRPTFSGNGIGLGLGWLHELHETGEPYGWGEAIFCGPNKPAATIGFFHDTGWYKDRISGFYDGDSGCGLRFTATEIEAMWREAGNLVQWRRPR